MGVFSALIGAFFKNCAVTSFSQLSENFYYNPPFIINNKNSCFMETGEDRHSRVCPFIETAERWNYLNYMSLTPHPNRRSKSPLVSYFQKKRHLHLYLTVITRPARPTSELSTEMGISKLSVLLSIIGKVCVLFLMLTSWILFLLFYYYYYLSLTRWQWMAGLFRYGLNLSHLKEPGAMIPFK